jgi:hypothetical protein
MKAKLHSEVVLSRAHKGPPGTSFYTEPEQVVHYLLPAYVLLSFLGPLDISHEMDLHSKTAASSTAASG